MARQADRSREDQPAAIGVMVRVLLVLACVALIYIPTLFNPSLLDGADAAEAQIARNMLRSGDWITPRLDGIPVFGKSPLLSWMLAGAFALLGESASAARFVLVVLILGTAWLVTRVGRWAFGSRAGVYAGLAYGTSAGLFWLNGTVSAELPLSAAVCLALWSLLRALDEEEPRPAMWAHTLAAAIGVSVLLQGPIALIWIGGTGVGYFALTRRLRNPRTWPRLEWTSGAVIVAGIVGPWFLFSTFANPPYFDWTLDPRPGQFRGFAWFYLIREHLVAAPISGDHLPFYASWAMQLAWLAPWSVYLPALVQQPFRTPDRASQTRLLCLIWIGFGLVLSTAPVFPAFAILLGSALTSESIWIRRASRAISLLAAVGLVAAFLWTTNLLVIPGLPPKDYIAALAGAGLAVGTWTAWRWRGTARYFGIAVMMVVVLNAARLAETDQQTSTAAMASALRGAPAGRVILGDHYFAFSAFVFEAGLDEVLLLNGRYRELEYGSHAKGAPDVFLSDSQFKPLWLGSERVYLLVKTPKLLGIEKLVGKEHLHLVRTSGDTHLFTNQAQ